MKKRFLIFTILLTTSLLTMAQKKVAVWDAKCIGGADLLFEADLVQGSLEETVDNMPGYKKYDRAMFDKVMKEHKFERSGAVDDNQIKEMGEYAGVDYIFVPSVASKSGYVNIVVRCIDIKFGESKTLQQLSSSAPPEIQKACEKLAERLLGGSTHAATRTGGMAKQGYVDLGLPSGTLWKAKNEEGFYSYEQAVNRFGNNLPTKEQYAELKDKCRWTWTGNDYKVVGPNGNSIVLPAAGFRHCSGTVYYVCSDGSYWSSTPNGSDNAWNLYFYSGEVYMGYRNRCYGHSVRLVQD